MGYQRENAKLQVKLDEIKMVNRAKCVLMQYLKLTEPQAHRYIEKQAMDTRETKLEVAKSILLRYEQ
jgi:response regulator NasT